MTSKSQIKRLNAQQSQRSEPTVKHLIMRLNNYNRWRRGGEFEQPNPKQFGDDIETAIKVIKEMEGSLSQIKQHIKIMTPTGYKMSGVYILACKGLPETYVCN